VVVGLIRFYLAVTVVLAHCGLKGWLFGGVQAVQMFFVISGFCMALVLNEKYREPNPTRFYLARYLRLWPAYAVVLLLTFIFLIPLPKLGILPSWQQVAFWFSTLTLFGNELLWVFGLGPQGLILSPDGSSNRLASLTGAPQMWSVGIELTFYAIAPFLARHFRRLLICLLFALMLHYCSDEIYSNTRALLRSATFNFWLFVSGMLSYWLWRSIKRNLNSFDFPAPAIAMAGVAISVATLYLHNNPAQSSPVLILFALAMAPVFHFTNANTLDRAIGELSYPIYVVHWPFAAYIIQTDNLSLRVILVVSLTLISAIAIRMLIEKPVEKIRRRLSNNIDVYT